MLLRLFLSLLFLFPLLAFPQDGAEKKEEKAAPITWENNPLMKMLSEQQRKAALEMIKKNPFGDLKKESVKTLILAKMDAKEPAGKYVHNSPRFLDFVAEWVVDDKAIPAFVSIVNKPKKAKKVGIIFITVFVILFLVNLKNSKKKFWQRIIIKIGLMFTSAGINLFAFYFIYKEELAPSIDVLMRHI